MYPSQYNKALGKFRNVHKGKFAILFATGPSIKNYQPFEGSEEAINVGVNRIYVYPEIVENLDYYFFGSHYDLDLQHGKDIENVCATADLVKLASAYENGISHAQIGRGNISPERALELGAIPFENNLEEFSHDIANYALLGHSIVFPALQVLLYTGVSRIYLVGCDGGETGRGGLASSGNQHMLFWWHKFKEFKDAHYPEVEIISINPVSLRGVFPDHANVSLMQSLYKKKRNLLSEDNLSSLDLIGEKIPLKIHRFQSGTDCFDWKIPQQWNLNRGVLKDASGNTIIDSEDNILHILSYSSPYKGEVTKEELLDHVYYDVQLPHAIPYRTSYYSDNWGFCLSYNDFKNLKDDTYTVDIDAKFTDGDLLIGEAVIRGKSDREVILSSYYCHPQQANDGLSGVILLVDLYHKLKEIESLKYTYRFFFWPETIGALAALSQGLIHKDKVEYALVATTVGYGDKICYKKTYLGNHSLDNLMTSLFKQNIEIKDFVPTGSDERQFSSPNLRIPTGVLTRTPYEEYQEYHTSEDNLDLVAIESIEEMAELYSNILLFYEKDPRYELQTKGGEPFLTKSNLYRQVGTPGHTDSEKLRNWVLFLSDGNHTVIDMSVKTSFEEAEIEECLQTLTANNIVKAAYTGTMNPHEKQLLLDYKEYYDKFEGRTWRTVESFEYCLDYIKMLKQEIGPKGKKVLEFGCGTGFNLNYLYHCGFKNLYGLDISKEAIEVASEKYKNINFSVSNGSQFGQASNSEKNFDFIFCRAVLQQPENSDYDVVSILFSLSDVLKSGGVLVVSEGAGVRDWERLFLTASFQTFFKDGDIRKLKKI